MPFHQVDAAKGFGGKYGVVEQKDKSALGWDHLEKVEKHTSSKGIVANLSRNVHFDPVPFLNAIRHNHVSKRSMSFFVSNQHLVSKRNCFVYISLSSPHQTTRWASEANLVSRRIVKTSRRLGGTTSRRSRSTSPKSTTRKASVGNMGLACKTRAPWGGNTTRKWTSMNPKKVPSFHSLPSLSCPVSPSSDYKSGFGGKFGVAEQKDKSALGWEHHEKVEKHESQKGELCI